MSASRLKMLRAGMFVCCLSSVGPQIIPAQDNAVPMSILRMQLSGSLRGRSENWDRVSAPAARSACTYGASVLRVRVAKSWKTAEWQVEGAFPLLLNLPANAVATAPQGPLGYGGDYFLANE